MNKKRRLALLFAVLFCLSAITFVVVAKYVKDIPFSGTVTFKAHLADNLTLTESRAIRQANGTYTLNTATPVSGNTYVLMPGVDIPKDPKITVYGKTAVPAYLYVEVISTLPADVTYAMADGWTVLGTPGPKGGTVYVYNTLLNGTPNEVTVQILKNNTLTVSQKLSQTATGTVTFYAYLCQQNGSAEASFNSAT